MEEFDEMERFYDEYPDAPQPDWSDGLAHGKYMTIGAQLPTRDGRLHGNAYVDEIYKNEDIGKDIAVCYTDAGTRLAFTEDELKFGFYPPVFIMNIEDARRRFRRE